MTGHNRKILIFRQSGTRYKTRFSISGSRSQKPLAEIHRLKKSHRLKLVPTENKYRCIDLNRACQRNCQPQFCVEVTLLAFNRTDPCKILVWVTFIIYESYDSLTMMIIRINHCFHYNYKPPELPFD